MHSVQLRCRFSIFRCNCLPKTKPNVGDHHAERVVTGESDRPPKNCEYRQIFGDIEKGMAGCRLGKKDTSARDVALFIIIPHRRCSGPDHVDLIFVVRRLHVNRTHRQLVNGQSHPRCTQKLPILGSPPETNFISSGRLKTCQTWVAGSSVVSVGTRISPYRIQPSLSDAPLRTSSTIFACRSAILR